MQRQAQQDGEPALVSTRDAEQRYRDADAADLPPELLGLPPHPPPRPRHLCPLQVSAMIAKNPHSVSLLTTMGEHHECAV